MMKSNAFRKQAGALMIEVLVSIAVIIIGLGALIQMQSALQKSEIESYQRSQAILLLNDMVSRIQSNRPNAEDYLTSTLTPSFLGGTNDELNCSSIGTTTLQQRDSQAWCDALKGAGETTGGSNVGAMIGGRGCVEQLGPAANSVYMVTVVWQGLVPVSAPPPSVTCGYKAPPDNPYDGVDPQPCKNDLCRRYVTAKVRLKEMPVL